ncbi:hypothetical protein F5050DRAFT_1275034 [Lentinula boryana]|uniref:Uncharacterized protein n=1 Tax=Lentinula boryana TaxID=40481 RepID=A0ABQ8QIE3_9AGAR|nr:hypothetical protein F5050DRAFT_1275034 [Lentinula boryana]
MIGGIIGGIVIVLLAIGSCFFYRRRPPRASIAHDTEAPPSPIFNPMAMIASSSRVTIPAQPSVVTKKSVPFYDVLNDENKTIKRTATFSRLSKSSYPRSSFSSQFTGARSSRYSSSSSSFVTSSDGDSIASTVKVGELIDPFADPEPSVLMADDPFADHLGNVGGEKSFRILPPVPQLRLTKPSPSPNDESTRVSQTSVMSSHWGVAM